MEDAEPKEENIFEAWNPLTTEKMNKLEQENNVEEEDKSDAVEIDDSSNTDVILAFFGDVLKQQKDNSVREMLEINNTEFKPDKSAYNPPKLEAEKSQALSQLSASLVNLSEVSSIKSTVKNMKELSKEISKLENQINILNNIKIDPKTGEMNGPEGQKIENLEGFLEEQKGNNIPIGGDDVNPPSQERDINQSYQIGGNKDNNESLKNNEDKPSSQPQIIGNSIPVSSAPEPKFPCLEFVGNLFEEQKVEFEKGKLLTVKSPEFRFKNNAPHSICPGDVKLKVTGYSSDGKEKEREVLFTNTFEYCSFLNSPQENLGPGQEFTSPAANDLKFIAPKENYSYLCKFDLVYCPFQTDSVFLQLNLRTISINQFTLKAILEKKKDEEDLSAKLKEEQERKERERIEKEKLEKERLEKERLEKERLEKERKER